MCRTVEHDVLMIPVEPVETPKWVEYYRERGMLSKDTTIPHLSKVSSLGHCHTRPLVADLTSLQD